MISSASAPGRLVKATAAFTARGTAGRFFAASLDRLTVSRLDVLSVLTYHRVDKLGARRHLVPGLLSATPAQFAQQMQLVAERYRPLAIEEVLEAHRRSSRLPPRSVLVTFDDAYRDFAEHAWPTLRALGIPVVLFVPTAFPGAPDTAFWWDRIHGACRATAAGELATSFGPLPLRTEADRATATRSLLRHLKTLSHDDLLAEVDRVERELGVPSPRSEVLSWDELRALARQGVALGAHSRRHPLLHRLDPAEVASEIAGSIDDLERETGRPVPAFAYPGGGLSDDVVRCVDEAGVPLAFTTGRGVNDLRHGNWLRLRRINVGLHTTTPVLRCELLPPLARLDRPASSPQLPVTIAAS